MNKTLGNTDAKGAKKNVKDIEFWGNGDTWELICKASSESEGWMKSTKAMEIPGVGCLVQVTTQQLNETDIPQQAQVGEFNIDAMVKHSVISESVTFVPGCQIAREYNDDVLVGRKLIKDTQI